MKKVYSLIIAAAVVAWAVPSFALVDVEGYGGLSFAGKFETPDKTATGAAASESVKVKGWDYGARAHYTDGFLIFDYGIGAFYQQKPLSYSLLSTDYKAVNTTSGADCYLRLGIIPVVKPFVRAGLAVTDYVETKAGGTKIKSDMKYFNSYYTGGGIGFTLPVPLVTIMFFGEYLYNRQIHSGKMTGSNVNFGLSLGI